ncbi:MAG: type II toxin-antitoxin system HicA family toxin [Candidatus Korobacteraceae bacterium]|jgi:predicted RNA binding protein YcfA (HicA-like mRNA interferase family)
MPRDLGGSELAKLLRRYGYEITRQTGSHLRLTSSIRGAEHHIAIPAHKNLKVGTLAGILKEVCAYLEMSRADMERELFSD